MKKKRSGSAGGSRNLADEGIKILFVDTLSLSRSPTAEKTWNRRAGVSARSAGVSYRAKKPLTARDIRWADYILVMEECHKNPLNKDFERLLKDKKIHTLDIPNDYKFMDPELVKKLEVVVAGIINQ